MAENGFESIKTVTQNEFIEGITDKFGNKTQALAAFKSVIDKITKDLKSRDSLSIYGFGTFKVEKRAASKSRNPVTGQEIEIPASTTVKFALSSMLKDEINGKTSK